MKTTAAVLNEVGQEWDVREIDVAEPSDGTVMVKWAAAGLCHSDEHVRDGTLPARIPMVGGHEGAGVVEKVGAGVDRVEAGDHIVGTFLPTCGHCRWCATGQQQICDLGATILDGCLPDGRFTFSDNGTEYGMMCMLGTFSQYSTVSQYSVVKVDKDLPLDKAALVGCGVPTGWGSAVYSAQTRPGDTIVVYGVGGIGQNAVQGARHAGAMNVVAVDPQANKREVAESFGATHSFEDAESAQAQIHEMTRGVGADSAIITVDVVTPEIVGAAFMTIRKGGNVVVTGLADLEGLTVSVPGTLMTLFKKTIQGSLFGDSNPTYDIPKILELYRSGQVKLDELITKTYKQDEINQGYKDLMDGTNIRGIIIYD